MVARQHGFSVVFTVDSGAGAGGGQALDVTSQAENYTDRHQLHQSPIYILVCAPPYSRRRNTQMQMQPAGVCHRAYVRNAAHQTVVGYFPMIKCPQCPRRPPACRDRWPSVQCMAAPGHPTMGTGCD